MAVCAVAKNYLLTEEGSMSHLAGLFGYPSAFQNHMASMIQLFWML
jgi:hypothetical protein